MSILKMQQQRKIFKETIMIKPCNCRSEYQNKEYGFNMRVHNKSKSRIAGKTAWTCTVCGTKKD